MRTQRISRYLTAMIIALGTSFNVFAQERNLKIYFNQYVDGTSEGTKPLMLVTDDNDNYGLPAGLTFSSEGMAWAKEARFFEWMTQDVNDRLIADYAKDKNGNVDKKNAKLKISFGNFPYEVNGIQWNVMNDLLSGSISDFFKNYNVTTTCTPVSGSGFTYTEEHWSMNIFQHSTTFVKGSIPWQDGAVLNGLKSFELSEKYYTELGLGSWTFINFGQAELSSKCRTFFKAGWNGDSGTGSNITDSDDDNWAFKLTFTLPQIRVRNSRDLYVGDVNQIEGYLSAHKGAVVVTTNPQDPDKFHFEYFASNDNITISQYTGVIEAKKEGEVNVTAKLYRGTNFVTSYTYELSVLKKEGTTSSPQAEICIAFANGNKGYDLTVGDTNAKIQGDIVSVSGGNIVVTGSTSSYHYEYTSENTEIADVDLYTGVITPKKEGDVELTAVLMKGNEPISNFYTYTLHVFAPNEGLDWDRVKTYNYSYNTKQQNTNKDLWIIKNYQTTLNPSHDWSPITLLKTDTYIKQNLDGSDNNSWKQIAAFTTPSVEYYRAICQKIKIDVRVPKYSKATATYKFAGNVTLVDQGNNNYTRYGLEIKDLGVVSSEEADNEINSIKLNTYNSGKNGMVSDPATLTTIVRAGAQNGYNAFMGASSEIPSWETDNKDGAAPTSETRYLAAMAYIHFNNSYSATTSIGYKGIPTYTYYSHVYYCKNFGENVGKFFKDEELYSVGKTGTKEMNQFSAPNRLGYTFLGWSENPDATTPEYIYKDQFCSYDAENGGGKGPVYLYAVWRPNTYTVTLDHNDGTGVTEQVNAVYNEDMPTFGANGEPLVAPVRDGYTFQGYFYYTEEDKEVRYYKADMTGARKWNMANNETVLYAKWVAKTYTVELRSNFDEEGYTVYGKVKATYGADMPSVDKDGNALVAPTKKGYDFNGYYRKDPTTIYYDKDFNSTHVWDRTDNYVVVRWSGHKTRVVFDLQGGILYYGATEVTATYGKNMPTVGLNQGESQNVGAPQRQGYTFGGYYSKENGAGTQYYTASMASAKTWNIDERTLNPQVEYVTLYAKWIPNTYTVTLDHNDGTGVTEQITVAYEQDMPEISLPTRSGYEFDGYWDNQTNGQGKQYYKANGSSASIWDKMDGGTIYAHWTPKTYIVTFDAGSATLPQGIIDGNKDLAIEQASDGIIKIRFTYGVSVNNIIDNSKPKKPAYNLLGFYDDNDVLVATVSVDDPDDRHIHLTGAGNYWEQNGTNVKWVHTGDLTLTAKYERKFTVVDGNMIKFGSEAKVEYVEPKHDWLMQVVNDLIGAAQEVGSKENPVMVFDMTDSKNIWTGGGYNCQEVMESLQASEYSDIISPNVLVYFNEGSYNNKNYETNKFASNAITADNKCLNLYVTDRYQMKIPYAFNAAKALYERNKVQKENDDLNDAMWNQSHKSVWGTLCLPYPITNNNTHKVSDGIDCKVIFYDLRKRSGNVMQFYKLAEDAVIPANTPVLYERTEGVSSAVTIEERSDIYDENVATINVPANPKFTTVTKTYADAPEPSIQKWQFIGSLEEKTFCGKDCTNPPAGAIRESEDLIYYFKTDNFTRMGDKTWMKLIPYRAYFREVGGAKGGAKISSYSILVVDENGATDITDAILGEGEGDGKIYDLNGIRVMQPVKGRLYIVNGKKKVYE